MLAVGVGQAQIYFFYQKAELGFIGQRSTVFGSILSNQIAQFGAA